MKKKDYKNLKLKHFEKKEKNDTNIAQKDEPQIKTPSSNSIDQETFYRRYRHIS